MNRIDIQVPKKFTVRVNKIVVPHDGSTFLGRDNKISHLTTDTQIEFVWFGIRQLLSQILQ